MTRDLMRGHTGPDVRDLQLTLNHRPPSELPPLDADGNFGAKTEARVKEFQRNYGLEDDGIVGSDTRAALIGLNLEPVNDETQCANGDPSAAAEAGAIAALFQANVPAIELAVPGAGPGGGPFRMLTPAQRLDAQSVFGTSLDLSAIFISDMSGLGGRPFTVAIDDGTGNVVQIMNCGTFTPRRSTLIHELAHAWQSQHHSDKYRYMVNAVDSQTGAVVASTAAATDDPFVALHVDWPTFWPFDAYAYHPSLPFSSLAAEQMAQAIENGEPAIMAHVKSVPINAVDPACVTALSKPGYADRRMRGVKR